MLADYNKMEDASRDGRLTMMKYIYIYIMKQKGLVETISLPNPESINLVTSHTWVSAFPLYSSKHRYQGCTLGGIL